jgi:hypothetical protein
MVNYFSIGECAKIGLKFEQNRTGSKCGNACMYAIQGLGVICCGCCGPKEEQDQLRRLRSMKHLQKINSPAED